MENPIKMDDLGVPLFLETSMSEIVGFFSIEPPRLGTGELEQRLNGPTRFVVSGSVDVGGAGSIETNG